MNPVRNRVSRMGAQNFVLMMVTVVDGRDQNSRDKDEDCRVMLRLHTREKKSANDLHGWANLPVTTVRRLMRSHDAVLCEVDLRNTGTSLDYEAIRFPIGDSPDTWVPLDLDEG